jgi:hypothetical protein
MMWGVDAHNPSVGKSPCFKCRGEIVYTSCISANLDEDELIKRIERLRSNNPLSKIDKEEMNARKYTLWR